MKDRKTKFRDLSQDAQVARNVYAAYIAATLHIATFLIYARIPFYGLLAVRSDTKWVEISAELSGYVALIIPLIVLITYFVSAERWASQNRQYTWLYVLLRFPATWILTYVFCYGWIASVQFVLLQVPGTYTYDPF
jgi:hypothetical protein